MRPLYLDSSSKSFTLIDSVFRAAECSSDPRDRLNLRDDNRFQDELGGGFILIDPDCCRRDDNKAQVEVRKGGFTLIELLVVIAIIAVLAVVVILVLNPAQLLQQARDSNRFSDLATINSAIGYYLEDQPSPSLGNVSTSYISVADSAATSTAGDQCQGSGMPSLGSSTWQCAQSSTFRQTNATGWIPVNLSAISVGSPLGQLPVDPANQTSTGLFYTYSAAAGKYEITAVMESSKYKSQLAANNEIPGYPEVAAQGSSFAVSPLWNPSGLVAWWPLTEGVGTTTYDQSGNGGSGSWNGTQAGTSGYYSGGKVGSWGGAFDGSTDWISIPAVSNRPTNAMTMSAWIYLGANVPGSGIAGILSSYCSTGGGFLRLVSGNKINFGGSGGGISGATSIPLGTWTLVAGTINASDTVIDYLNGVVDGSGTTSGSLFGSGQVCIGTDYLHDGTRNLTGEIDDVRVYNRTLSPAEIQALYNAEK